MILIKKEIPFTQAELKEKGKKMPLEEHLDLTEEELDLLDLIREQKLKPNEAKLFLKALKHKTAVEKKDYFIGKSKVRFGIISDTHFGNIFYDKYLYSKAIEQFNKEKVDFVIHPGDILDGWYQNRPQSIFEQNALGVDQQIELAVKELSRIKQPLYFITGNHEYNTFMRNAGMEAGSYLEDLLKSKGVDATFLGNGEGNLVLKSGIKLKVLHPDSGTAYALSYKPQKIAESLEGGHKPNVLLIGHFHKAEYLFYRNIHILQCGTLCGQTKFMKGRAISAHKGFWIVDLYSDSKKGVSKITPSFYPAYD